MSSSSASSAKRPHHVIVGGTGAVGLVYAHALLQSNCDVTLFVRKQYVEAFAEQLKSENVQQPSMKLYDLSPRITLFYISRLATFIGLSMLLSTLWSSHMKSSLVLQLVAFLLITALGINRWTPPKAKTQLVSGFKVVSELAQLKELQVDYLWLCVSSPQLRSQNGDFVRGLVAAVGEATTIVNMSPGIDDRSFLETQCHLPAHRIIHGGISFLAYQAPLPFEVTHLDGESATHSVEEIAKWKKQGGKPAPGMKHGLGVAYLYAPLSPSPFFQTTAASAVPAPLNPTAPKPLKELVDSLKNGGLPAKIELKHEPKDLFLIPMLALHPLLAVMEVNGWKWSRLLSTKGELDRALKASAEALRIVPKMYPSRSIPTPVFFLLSPILVRVVLTILPYIVPLPMERFIEWHFGKVNDQTLDLLRSLTAKARTHQVPSPQLDAIVQQLEVVQKRK